MLKKKVEIKKLKIYLVIFSKRLDFIRSICKKTYIGLQYDKYYELFYYSFNGEYTVFLIEELKIMEKKLINKGILLFVEIKEKKIMSLKIFELLLLLGVKRFLVFNIFCKFFSEVFLKVCKRWFFILNFIKNKRLGNGNF